jgi:hypothetical protein
VRPFTVEGTRAAAVMALFSARSPIPIGKDDRPRERAGMRRIRSSRHEISGTAFFAMCDVAHVMSSFPSTASSGRL